MNKEGETKTVPTLGIDRKSLESMSAVPGLFSVTLVREHWEMHFMGHWRVTLYALWPDLLDLILQQRKEQNPNSQDTLPDTS